MQRRVRRQHPNSAKLPPTPSLFSFSSTAVSRTMSSSFTALARGIAARTGSNSLRSSRRLPVAASSGNNSLTANAARSTQTAPTRRFMGGGGGHQPVSRSMEAELWQGHPKEPEGWETTIYLTYGATAVLLAFALGFAPDTSIKTVSKY